MRHSIATETTNGNEHPPDALHRHEGFIVFCEKNLRYEKGIKAWIFLGPYLLGALVLEIVIDSGQAISSPLMGPWGILLAYLVLFPSAWQRILKLATAKKATSSGQCACKAVKVQ